MEYHISILNKCTCSFATLYTTLYIAQELVYYSVYSNSVLTALYTTLNIV